MLSLLGPANVGLIYVSMHIDTEFFFLITYLWKNLFISSKVFPFANFCFQCKRSGKLAVISNLDILSTVSGKCPTMSKVHAVQENLLQTIQDING